MSVVVVDDEPDLREIVQIVLEDAGLHVISFGEPVPSAQFRATDDEPDIFLIDIMLPGMSGIELAAQLQAEGFASTPKIAISASRDRLAQAQASGLFVATINKPFEITTLVETVEAHLGS